MNAARSRHSRVPTHWLPVAVTNGSIILAAARYPWPYQKKGSLWAISRDSTIYLVDFSGEKITSDQISTVGQWIELR